MKSRLLNIALSICLALPFPSLAQPTIKPDGTVDSELRDVIAKYSSSGDFAALGPKDQIFVPPTVRYRFKLAVTGQIRPISEPRRIAIGRWATSNRAAQFADEFTHEVEVRDGETNFWLPWQRTLVDPFNTEMSQGGSMSARVLFIGAVQAEFLFLALGYQQLSGLTTR